MSAPGGRRTFEVHTSGVIHAPVETVWSFMADLDTMPLRDPSVVGVDWHPPLRVGSTATIAFRQMGVRKGIYEVKLWEPSRMFRVQLTAMGARVVGTGTWVFEPTDGGKTRLSASVQVEIRGVMRFLSPLFSWSAKRGASAGFRRIKRAIESQSCNP